MKTTYTLIVTAALCASIAHAQNSCSSAVLVTAGTTYTIDAINGPEIPIPICATTGVGATHTEWYKYVPAYDYSLTISTDLPQNAGGDTRFNVYQGNCGGLSCVGGADDQGSNTLASTTVQVSGGLTYRIAFDDRWSNAGFDFTLTEGPPVVTAFNFVQQAIPGGISSDCVVDMNNDGLDDIVSGSTNMVRILRQQAGGSFLESDISIPTAANSPSWSICAGDLNGDGHTDLMYGGGGGTSLILSANGGTSFTQISPAQYIFCQRTNMVDINNDGNLDAYSCHDVDANVSFMNDGAGNFVFGQGGLGTTCGNYGSIWVDYDNDHDMDMFVAKCGCDPHDLLMRNNGDGTFTDVSPALGLSDTHQSWSSAWGDFDNDGDLDMLIGSSSSNVHKLMRNDGGTFTNVTIGSGYDTFGGQSIEWTTHDFNNDGHLDILGGGALMLGNGDMTFATAAVSAPYSGPVGDLNNDGFLDIISGNTIYLNTGNTNKYLTVDLTGTVSNRDGIGARIEVTSDMGTQIREIRSGDAFSTMSSLMAHFGLGTDTHIASVTVYWPSGIVDVIDEPAINSRLNIVEGTFTAIPASATKGFSVFPSPAEDVLNVRADVDLNNGATTVMNVTGQRVMTTHLRNDQLDISSLKSGVYLIRIELAGRVLNSRFVKR